MLVQQGYILTVEKLAPKTSSRTPGASDTAYLTRCAKHCWIWR